MSYCEVKTPVKGILEANFIRQEDDNSVDHKVEKILGRSCILVITRFFFTSWFNKHLH